MLTTVATKKRAKIWLYTYTVSEVKLLTTLIQKTKNDSFNETQISMAIYRLTAAQT